METLDDTSFLPRNEIAPLCVNIRSSLERITKAVRLGDFNHESLDVVKQAVLNCRTLAKEAKTPENENAAKEQLDIAYSILLTVAIAKQYVQVVQQMNRCLIEAIESQNGANAIIESLDIIEQFAHRRFEYKKKEKPND